MPKNIVLCSDGTGNSGGKGKATNVWRVYQSVDLIPLQASSGSLPTRQLAFYDDGVGTDRMKLLKLLGGAFGLGLSRNVKQLYTTLVANFEAGDHIYLFGFSRGAFTVRILAGLITTCGIVDRRHPEEDRFLDDAELKDRVSAAYRTYRQKYTARLTQLLDSGDLRRDLKHLDAKAFRQQHGVRVTGDQYRDYANIGADPSEEHFVPIRFMGVWDTVDAVGFPLEEIAEFWNRYIYPFKFPDHALSQWVNQACHALSIDDQRRSFSPLMFNESDPRDESRIEQVWFPGAHCNVGGGYPKQGMAHLALNWMMDKAEAAGLRFDAYDKAAYRAGANLHDKLYDSRAGLSVYYRYAPRDIQQLCRNDGVAQIQVHLSTFQRILARTQGYAPGNLAPFEVVVDDATQPGASPADQARLAERCAAGWAGEEGRLYQQTQLVNCYKVLHALFTAGSLFVLVMGYIYGKFLAPVAEPSNLLLSGAQLITRPIPFAGDLLYKAVLVPLLSHLTFGLFILCIPIYLYVADSVLKGVLERRYQRFWRRILAEPWCG
jgi:uncharacterized protein (DUF2235 family)